MSAELIEDVKDDRGVSVGLAMSAKGFATLTLYGPEDHEPDIEMVSLRLPPNADGLRNAEAIEGALRAWREAVARLDR